MGYALLSETISFQNLQHYQLEQVYAFRLSKFSQSKTNMPPLSAPLRLLWVLKMGSKKTSIYSKLDTILSSTPKDDKIIHLGEFNARVRNGYRL